MKKIISKSETETSLLAKQIINNLSNNRVIALIGDLGSGKTVLTKSIAKELKIKDIISSPTFNIMKIYQIFPSKKHNFKQLCHIDAYRLKNFYDLESLGIKNYFDSPETITIIEWADKIEDFLPKDSIIITFNYGKKDNERIITIK